MDNISTEEYVRRYTGKDNIIYRFFRFVIFVVAHILYRPKFSGKEKIPAQGAAIIASNHRYWADAGMTLLATRRPVHYLAKRELHDNRWYGWIFRTCLTIPVDREKGSHESIVAADKLLNEGELVAIFPEGTRNRTEEPLQPFKMGTVKMASDTGAPIIPLVCNGGHKPFTSYIVTIGDPYYVTEGMDLEKANDELWHIMVDMVEKKEKE